MLFTKLHVYKIETPVILVVITIFKSIEFFLYFLKGWL